MSRSILLTGCVGIVALVLLATAAPASAQISPGPLAKAHAELEGALNCARCHGPRRESMSAQCRSCHREIGWLVEQNRGYHATRAAREKECAACHPDHAGAGFDLVAWPGGSAERFNHADAGWTLDGSHAGLRCESCHATPYRVSASARLSPGRNGARWTGLETACATCHAGDDAHRGALRDDCASCHDASDWASAPGFSHDETPYPLTGRHTRVSCDGCHRSPRLPLRKDSSGELVPIYAPVPFRRCGDCHDDPHAGRFSASCTDCHTTAGFGVGGSGGGRFNHARTRYPLQGRHARVACAACHGPDLTTAKPAFERCESCHSDPHRGEAVLAGKPADCAACHGVAGFSPSTYTIEQHASAPYPLEGRHREVACARCHVPLGRASAAADRAVGRLRLQFARCGDCHADAHAGQLAARPGAGACEDCHAVTGFAPSTFTAVSHAKLRLALDGRHAELPCRACHGGTREGLPAPASKTSLGSAGVAVALAGASCTSCHVDPHAGRYDAAGALPVEGGCLACHDARAFRPWRLDDSGHDRFAFRLDGAHRAVPCVGCHETMGRAAAPSTLLLAARDIAPFPAAGAARTCATCHDNPHGNQFSTRANKCESCHGVASFVPAAGFDHERDSTFPLAGAHAMVACGKCHVQRVVDGRTTYVYRPLSSRCESCHKGAAP